MTSNLGGDSMSNDLSHVFLFKHVVACNSEKNKNYSSMLGYDEHCQSLDMNKNFTCMCKQSCTIFISKKKLQYFHVVYFLKQFFGFIFHEICAIQEVLSRHFWSKRR